MIPDPEAGGVSVPSQGPLPPRAPRRSRRGGRRHSGRRERPAAESTTESAGAVERAAEPVEVAGEPEVQPISQPEQAEQAEPRRQSGSAVAHAIQQVTHIVEELKRALEEMEEVLETLEFAERQKIDDEREIENLEHALRKLHRPVQPPTQPRH